MGLKSPIRDDFPAATMRALSAFRYLLLSMILYKFDIIITYKRIKIVKILNETK